MIKLNRKGLEFLSIVALVLALTIAIQGVIGAQPTQIPQIPNPPALDAQITIFQAAFLGMVQGITEFLPISSTAHLLIVRDLFGWNAIEKYYIDAIQFGSVIAVVIYFRSDIIKILSGSWSAWQGKDWQREEWKLLVGIAVGTLPALIVGYLCKDIIPENLKIIAIALIVMGLLLGLAEKLGKRARGFKSLSIKDGFLVGLGQMIALIPGASRSGSTLTVALFLGLKRQTAARFSFLLGIPTLTIATLFEARKALGSLDNLFALLVGIVSAFIFSYLAIAWLLHYLQKQDTWIFVWYRVALGLLILGVLAGNFKSFSYF